MEANMIIPLVGQLLSLGLRIADIIDKAENVSDEDKMAMKAEILKARDGVTYWDETTEDGN